MIPTLPKTFRNSAMNISKLLFVLAVYMNFGIIENAHAQVSAYSVTQNAFTAGYTTFPLPGKTNLAPTSGTTDDAVYNIPIGFNFIFNGASYSTLNVSMNGFVTFGATAPTSANYNPISSSEAYSGAISVYGRDLDLLSPSATINLGYLTSGSAGSKILKVEWTGRRSTGANSGVDTNPMVFQLWLYETTNVIEMIYNAVYIPSSTTSLTGQIGLRGSTNTDFVNLSYTNPAAPWPTLPSTMVVGTASNTDSAITRGNNASSAIIVTGSNRIFRWTPVTCFAPTGLSVTSITYNAATLNWSAATPAPANGYQYYITTSATLPTGATTPTGTGIAGLTQALSSLTPGQQYYVYVRSECSVSDVSSWSSGVTFTTLCNPVNVPYYQYFDGPIVPAISPFQTASLASCTSEQNVGLGNNWSTADANHFTNSGMTNNILMYDGSIIGNVNPANVWFFTQGVNLVAGTSYKISYLYGGTDTPSTVQNKMLVAYGTAPNAASMTLPLDDHPDIKSSPFSNVINFTAPTSAAYYFGLKAYSNNNNGQLFVDDLKVEIATCLKPTAVSVSNIGPSSAILSWTQPSPAPSGGYAYYFNTTGLAPTNSTIPNGFTGAGINNVTLTGLAGTTNYYFWVRSNCGGGEFGEWVALVNGANSYFTTLVQLNYCVSTGGSANYFTNFTTTNAITNVSNPTGFAPSGYGDYTSQIITQAQSGTVNVTTSYNDMAGGVGIAMFVDWNQDGDFVDAGETVYNSAAYLSSPPAVTFTVPAGATLGITRMRIVVDWNATSPSPCGAKTRGETEDYSFQVVTPPPALVIDNPNDTVCAGSPSNPIVVTSGLLSYNSFSWSPSTGVTGSGTVGDPYIITSNTTQTFTLTASQTSAPFRFNTVRFVYNANPLPTPITIATPSGTNACQNGPAIPLVATGGIVSGFPILSENFNGASNSWTVTGSGTGSPIGDWTLRPDGYSIPLGTTHSNDSSQFYHANSDQPGFGTVVTTSLTSPAFSTVGYSQASLSFWHVYRYYSGDTGKVQISTNGSTWTDLAVYSSNQAGLTAFDNVIIPLNAYLGQPTVYIRFRYDAGWDWFWGIDNVLVSGSASSAVTWTPVAGLYNDAAASSPYVLGTGAATVYAMPAIGTTYTASASTPAPVCSATTNVSVTVTPIVAGTASGNQTVCYGLPTNLTLAGYSGTITGWQYATNFAFTTPINIPASASATLTGAQMGILSANRYYRAVVTNGSCTAYSNVITVTINETTWSSGSWSNGLPNSTKVAYFDDDYDTLSDGALSGTVLNACAVYVLSGTVTINSGFTLYVENVVDASGGSLIFENNASLVQVSGVANVGDIVYYRDTTPVTIYDYTYWSSPVSPQTLVALSPLTLSDKYFAFDSALNNWVGVPSNSLMSSGKGYIIRSPQTFSTVTPSVFHAFFTGVPNNGNIFTPIIGSTGTVNLIGNPYASALNADLFLSDPSNTPYIDGTIYLWTHNSPVAANNYSASDYASYNYSGGTGTGTAALGTNNSVPTGKIAAGQGFFIKGLADGNVVFKNSMRVNNNNTQFYRNNSQSSTSTLTELERNRVWLELFNNQGAYKQTLVGYIETATNDKDRGFDGEVLEAGNVVSFYSILGSNKLGIQGRALPFEVTDLVPLGYTSLEATGYQVRLSDFDGLFETQDVYLEDKLLNVIHNLKESDYSFTTAVGTFEDRFVLRFANSSLGVNNASFSDETVVVYNVNQTIHINTSNSEMESVTIYDVRGRELYSKKQINNNELIITNLNSSQQVLLVKVTNVDGKIVNKKIVFN